MTTENRDDRDFDDSTTSEGGAVRKADGAIRDTAQKYLDRSGSSSICTRLKKLSARNPCVPPRSPLARDSSSVAGWSRAWAWRRLHYLAARPLEKRRPTSSAEVCGRIPDDLHRSEVAKPIGPRLAAQ